MNYKTRLQSARHWIPKYEGGNIVRGYRKHYGVDWLCAIKELELLGVNLDPSYVAELRRSVEARQKERQHKKLEKKVMMEELDNDFDETFAYIAGYTPGGFPYGIMWEEWEKMDQIKSQDEEI